MVIFVAGGAGMIVPSQVIECSVPVTKFRFHFWDYSNALRIPPLSSGIHELVAQNANVEAFVCATWVWAVVCAALHRALLKKCPKIDPKSFQNRPKIDPKTVQNSSKIGPGTDIGFEADF